MGALVLHHQEREMGMLTDMPGKVVLLTLFSSRKSFTRTQAPISVATGESSESAFPRRLFRCLGFLRGWSNILSRISHSVVSLKNHLVTRVPCVHTKLFSVMLRNPFAPHLDCYRKFSGAQTRFPCHTCQARLNPLQAY